MTYYRNGRINERNIGKHKLDGGAKRLKPAPVVEIPYPSDPMTEKALQEFETIKGILKKGYVEVFTYSPMPEIYEQWLEKGLVQIGERVMVWRLPKIEFTPCLRVVEDRRSDFEFAAGLLKDFYKLDQYLETK